MTSMGNNTAAIYLRKSTEDDGKSVAAGMEEERTGSKSRFLPNRSPIRAPIHTSNSDTSADT